MTAEKRRRLLTPRQRAVLRELSDAGVGGLAAWRYSGHSNNIIERLLGWEYVSVRDSDATGRLRVYITDHGRAALDGRENPICQK